MYKINADDFDYMLPNRKNSRYENDDFRVEKELDDICRNDEDNLYDSNPFIIIRENGKINYDIDLRSVPSKIIINNVNRKNFELDIAEYDFIDYIALYKDGCEINVKKDVTIFSDQYLAFFISKGTYELEFKIGFIPDPLVDDEEDRSDFSECADVRILIDIN